MGVAVFNASTYPNIAAAKLAAMHGADLHDDLNLFTPVPGRAFISAIFSWERSRAEDWWATLQANGCEVEIGGPGISAETRNDIEDYVLEGFSQSYTSVGCPRECPWCLVPRMWPQLRELEDWGYAPVMLDSNILATSEEHKARVVRKLAGRRVRWDSGLDTRLLDRSNATFVASTSERMMFLSWDSGEDPEPLAKALENLRTVGVDTRQRVKVFVLTGYEGGWEAGYQRAAAIKNLGAMPFVMLYQPLFGEKIIYPKIYRDLSRWSNKTQILWSCDFAEYSWPKAAREESSGESTSAVALL